MSGLNAADQRFESIGELRVLAIEDAAMRTDIEVELLAFLGDKDHRDASSPGIADLEIHIGPPVRQIGNDKIRGLYPSFDPFEHIPREVCLIDPLADEAAVTDRGVDPELV